MFLRTWLLTVIFLGTLIHYTQARGVLTIRLLNFENKKGRTYDGSCCDHTPLADNTCPDQCDYVMRLIVSGLGRANDHVFLFHRPLKYDANDISFQKETTDMVLTVLFDEWPEMGNVKLNVFFYDYDDYDHTTLLVDWFENELAGSASRGTYTNSVVQGNRQHDKTTLEFEWTVHCFTANDCLKPPPEWKSWPWDRITQATTTLPQSTEKAPPPTTTLDLSSEANAHRWNNGQWKKSPFTPAGNNDENDDQDTPAVGSADVKKINQGTEKKANAVNNNTGKKGFQDRKGLSAVNSEDKESKLATESDSNSRPGHKSENKPIKPIQTVARKKYAPKNISPTERLPSISAPEKISPVSSSGVEPDRRSRTSFKGTSKNSFDSRNGVPPFRAPESKETNTVKSTVQREKSPVEKPRSNADVNLSRKTSSAKLATKHHRLKTTTDATVQQSSSTTKRRRKGPRKIVATNPTAPAHRSKNTPHQPQEKHSFISPLPSNIRRNNKHTDPKIEKQHSDKNNPKLHTVATPTRAYTMKNSVTLDKHFRNGINSVASRDRPPELTYSRRKQSTASAHETTTVKVPKTGLGNNSKKRLGFRKRKQFAGLLKNRFQLMHESDKVNKDNKAKPLARFPSKSTTEQFELKDQKDDSDSKQDEGKEDTGAIGHISKTVKMSTLQTSTSSNDNKAVSQKPFQPWTRRRITQRQKPTTITHKKLDTSKPTTVIVTNKGTKPTTTNPSRRTKRVRGKFSSWAVPTAAAATKQSISTKPTVSPPEIKVSNSKKDFKSFKPVRKGRPPTKAQKTGRPVHSTTESSVNIKSKQNSTPKESILKKAKVQNAQEKDNNLSHQTTKGSPFKPALATKTLQRDMVKDLKKAIEDNLTQFVSKDTDLLYMKVNPKVEAKDLQFDSQKKETRPGGISAATTGSLEDAGSSTSTMSTSSRSPAWTHFTRWWQKLNTEATLPTPKFIPAGVNEGKVYVINNEYERMKAAHKKSPFKPSKSTSKKKTKPRHKAKSGRSRILDPTQTVRPSQAIKRGHVKSKKQWTRRPVSVASKTVISTTSAATQKITRKSNKKIKITTRWGKQQQTKPSTLPTRPKIASTKHMDMTTKRSFSRRTLRTRGWNRLTSTSPSTRKSFSGVSSTSVPPQTTHSFRTTKTWQRRKMPSSRRQHLPSSPSPVSASPAFKKPKSKDVKQEGKVINPFNKKSTIPTVPTTTRRWGRWKPRTVKPVVKESSKAKATTTSREHKNVKLTTMRKPMLNDFIPQTTRKWRYVTKKSPFNQDKTTNIWEGLMSTRIITTRRPIEKRTRIPVYTPRRRVKAIPKVKKWEEDSRKESTSKGMNRNRNPRLNPHQTNPQRKTDSSKTNLKSIPKLKAWEHDQTIKSTFDNLSENKNNKVKAIPKLKTWEEDLANINSQSKQRSKTRPSKSNEKNPMSSEKDFKKVTSLKATEKTTRSTRWWQRQTTTKRHQTTTNPSKSKAFRTTTTPTKQTRRTRWWERKNTKQTMSTPTSRHVTTSLSSSTTSRPTRWWERKTTTSPKTSITDKSMGVTKSTVPKFRTTKSWNRDYGKVSEKTQVTVKVDDENKVVMSSTVKPRPTRWWQRRTTISDRSDAKSAPKMVSVATSGKDLGRSRTTKAWVRSRTTLEPAGTSENVKNRNIATTVTPITTKSWQRNFKRRKGTTLGQHSGITVSPKTKPKVTPKSKLSPFEPRETQKKFKDSSPADTKKVTKSAELVTKQSKPTTARHTTKSWKRVRPTTKSNTPISKMEDTTSSRTTLSNHKVTASWWKKRQNAKEDKKSKKHFRTTSTAPTTKSHRITRWWQRQKSTTTSAVRTKALTTTKATSRKPQVHTRPTRWWKRKTSTTTEIPTKLKINNKSRTTLNVQARTTRVPKIQDTKGSKEAQTPSKHDKQPNKNKPSKGQADTAINGSSTTKPGIWKDTVKTTQRSRVTGKHIVSSKKSDSQDKKWTLLPAPDAKRGRGVTTPRLSVTRKKAKMWNIFEFLPDVLSKMYNGKSVKKEERTKNNTTPDQGMSAAGAKERPKVSVKTSSSTLAGTSTTIAFSGNISKSTKPKSKLLTTLLQTTSTRRSSSTSTHPPKHRNSSPSSTKQASSSPEPTTTKGENPTPIIKAEKKFSKKITKSPVTTTKPKTSTKKSVTNGRTASAKSTITTKITTTVKEKTTKPTTPQPSTKSQTSSITPSTTRKKSKSASKENAKITSKQVVASTTLSSIIKSTKLVKTTTKSTPKQSKEKAKATKDAKIKNKKNKAKKNKSKKSKVKSTPKTTVKITTTKNPDTKKKNAQPIVVKKLDKNFDLGKFGLNFGNFKLGKKASTVKPKAEKGKKDKKTTSKDKKKKGINIETNVKKTEQKDEKKKIGISVDNLKPTVKKKQPTKTVITKKFLRPVVTVVNNTADIGPRVIVPKGGLFVPGPTKIVKILTAQQDENGTVHEEEMFVAIPSNSEAQHIGLQVKRLNIQTVFNRYWPAILGLTIGTAFLVAAVLTSVACRAQRLYVQRTRFDQPQHLTEPPDTSEYSSSAASLVSDATRSSIRL